MSDISVRPPLIIFVSSRGGSWTFRDNPPENWDFFRQERKCQCDPYILEIKDNRSFKTPFAAISEEFVFRMFAVSFLKKFMRFTFLAILIPSIIWAFAHSSYAVFPIYTRGIELTIVALAFCFVYLRYGILACIIAHYVIDAVLFSIPLLRSSNMYFLTSGLIVIALAGIPALFGLFPKKQTD